jgi:hypothetical protein
LIKLRALKAPPVEYAVPCSELLPSASRRYSPRIVMPSSKLPLWMIPRWQKTFGLDLLEREKQKKFMKDMVAVGEGEACVCVKNSLHWI